MVKNMPEEIRTTKEHGPHSLFRYYRLMEEKVFTNPDGTKKTELLPYIPKTPEAKTIALSVEGLNLIRQWTLIKRDALKPEDENKNIKERKKIDLETLFQESFLMVTLKNAIDKSISIKRNSQEEAGKAMEALEDAVKNVRMMVNPQLLNSKPPAFVNINIKSDDQIEDYIKRSTGLRHNIGSSLTKIHGFIELCRDYHKPIDAFRERLFQSMRGASMTINGEMTKLFREVQSRLISPDEIDGFFLDIIVGELATEWKDKPHFFDSKVDEKVKGVAVYCSEENLRSLFTNITDNFKNIYQAKDAIGEERAKEQRVVLQDIRLSDDGLNMEIRIRDNGLGFPDELIKNGYRSANRVGYRPKEVTATGHREVESHGIGMKVEVADMEEKYGGRIVLGNYEDTITINRKPVQIYGGEQTIILPAIPTLGNTHPKGGIGRHLR